jgi:hypothetical protein
VAGRAVYSPGRGYGQPKLIDSLRAHGFTSAAQTHAHTTPRTIKDSMQLKFSPRDSAFALFIIATWGMNFVIMKYALRDFTAFQMGAARFLFTVCAKA